MSLTSMLGTPKGFDDPFITESSNNMPRELKDALEFCIFLYYLNPQYRRASQRVVAHFVNDIGFSGKGGDRREQKELVDYLENDLDIRGTLLTMGEEWAAFGNSFWRIAFPFDRVLIDSRGQSVKEISLAAFKERDVRFDLQTMSYEVPDPDEKGNRVSFSFRDRRVTKQEGIRFIQLTPLNMTIRHSSMSGDSEYIYRFEADFEQDIRRGELYQVNKTPLAMLRAIRAHQDFLFNRDEIFHFKAPTISGVSTRGWGVPEPLANYRSLRQLQVYRKIDEQVGRDYLLPFRLFSPTDTDKETGHGFQIDSGEWTHHIRQLIRDRRLKPEAIHAFPHPVNYQEFGAAGKELTPKDLIEFQTNDMLDGMGYPAELFRGSLQVPQIPTALRLFESTFHFIHQGYERFLKWSVRRILSHLGREQMGVHLQLPSIADDLEQRNVYMQLAAGGEISRATAFGNFNIKDPIEEQRQRSKEDAEIRRIQARAEAEARKEAEEGAVVDAATRETDGPDSEASPEGGGGPGAAAGGGTPVDSLQQQAEELAGQLLQIPDNGTRAKELGNIRATNPELHAMIKQKMEEMRAAGASEGRKQVAQMVQ